MATLARIIILALAADGIRYGWHHGDSGAFVFVVSMIIFAFAIPCKIDPAVLIKEWQIKQGWHPESRPDEGEDPR